MNQLRTLNSYQTFKIKNKKLKKLIAVDVLFKAYPMVHSHADPIWPDVTFKHFENQTDKLNTGDEPGIC